MIKNGDLIEIRKTNDYDVTIFDPNETIENRFCSNSEVYINGKKANNKDTKYVLSSYKKAMLKFYKEIEKETINGKSKIKNPKGIR